MSVEGRATLLIQQSPGSRPMRIASLVLALLVIPLSGCISEPAADPAIVQAPDDFEYLDEPSPAGHVHDYWHGEPELVLLQREYHATNGVATNSPSGYHQLLPSLEDGTVVPQGTGWLHVRVDLATDPQSKHGDTQVMATPPTDELVVLGPADEDIIFPLGPAMADAPHQQVSDWTFFLNFTGEDDVFYFSGRITVSIVAVRGPDPLPVFPEHPDLWRGRSQIRLFNESFTRVGVHWDPAFDGCSGVGGCIWVSTSEQVVPPDADHVAVSIRETTGAPIMMDLLYHGADTRAWQEAEAMDADGGRIFHIGVGTRGDSPYATSSLWTFRFQPVQTAVAGSYEVSADVYRYPEVGPRTL